MGRLPGFDYTRPFFYMVTIKALAGFAGGRADGHRPLPFSAVSPEGHIMPNAITQAFEKTIRDWGPIRPKPRSFPVAKCIVAPMPWWTGRWRIQPST